MEYIFLIFISENLMAAGERRGSPFSCFLDLDINYLLEVSGIHITVFILLCKFQQREQFDCLGQKGLTWTSVSNLMC